MRKPVRIGVGGPVGSGKTALIEKLCKELREDYQIGVVTNDIFTKEDALILTRAEALPEDPATSLWPPGSSSPPSWLCCCSP